MKMRMVYLSIQSTDAEAVRRTSEDLASEKGWDLDFFGINGNDADQDPVAYHDLVNRTKAADLVLIRVMADPYRMLRFEQYEEVLKGVEGSVFLYSGNPEISELYRPLFRYGDEDFKRIYQYCQAKGVANDRAVVMWLHRALTGEGDVPEPDVPRGHGVYHPGSDRDVSLEDYRRTLDPSRPTVGIVFPGGNWLYGDMQHIDAFILALEGQGMNTIPIFSGRSDDTIEDVFRMYFFDGDRRLVDALVMATGFSFVKGSRDCTGVYTPDEQNFFHTLTDVPVFQAMAPSVHFADYEERAEGLVKGDFDAFVIWPEIDGQIITVPIGSNEQGRGAPRMHTPLPDRIDHLARCVGSWVRMGRTPRKDRRIAVLLWQSRPDSGRIGAAAGLDTIQSVRDMLERFRDLGYTVDHVPETSKELIDEILSNVTNDLEWSSEERVREKAADTVSVEEYRRDYDGLSAFNRGQMEDSWGDPPGSICTQDGRFVVPGIVNGNIYIGYQPMRGWAEQMEAVYHDPVLPPQHQYLAFYRWLRRGFGADAVIHMGTHGTLEWLPGRNVALSGKCYPDLILDGIPDIYPYVIDDPGEGIQCKRRAEAVLIGHMCPTMARAGSYDALESVDAPLQEIFKNRAAKGEQRAAMVGEVLEASRRAELLKELGIPDDISPEDFEGELDRIHDYLTEIKDAIIRDGLHVLGQAPEGDLLQESVYSLTRLANGDVPSLRDSVASSMGYAIDAILDDPSGSTGGELNSIVLDRIDERTNELIVEIQRRGYDADSCMELAEGDADLGDVIGFICGFLVPGLGRMKDELGNMMHACDGGYVLPGPSGAPTRGNARILPMGRNFYGIDPDIVPTKASWEVGRRMADQMIEKYEEQRGSTPREVGFIIWATDTMKNNGDDVAYILWLMGIRPVWSSHGNQVVGLEVIPLEELKRPRIDVTVRITGLFRDTFPNLIDMLDDAARMVEELDESDEENIMAANFRKDLIEEMAKGISVDEARRNASVRVFGCAPGGYGAGVNKAIESGDWKTVQDLADIYVTWGSYAYGRGMSGVPMKEQFKRRFSKVGVTVKNMPDREIDLLDCDDVYQYLGGLNAFVRAYGDPEAITVMGDGSDPGRVKIRGTKEELQFVYRTKILNPKFIDGLKRHGYRGVTEVANLTEYTLGWDATSDIVDDWVYEKLAETYLFDDDTREWMETENPHAMMDVMSRLFEAVDRGLWEARPETLERMKEIYLDLEGKVEDVQDRLN